MKKIIVSVLCMFLITSMATGCSSSRTYSDVKQPQTARQSYYRMSKLAEWVEDGYTVRVYCDNETGVVYMRYGQYLSFCMVDRDGKPLTKDNWLNPYPNEKTTTNTNENVTTEQNSGNTGINNNIIINNNQ